MAQAKAGDEWRTSDTWRQAGVTTLFVVDWAQTLQIAKNPDKYREIGWQGARLLSEHPSVAQVNQYMAGTIVVHAAISYLLPHGWRDAWQYVWIGSEADVVRKNHLIGIRIPL
jgi:hypothetical protein